VSQEPEPGLEELLAEQQRHYRARASTYSEEALAPLGGAEAAALRRDLGEAFDAHFRGDVLELACGPGTWTSMLAQRARTVTALDGAPEMLKEAARSAPGARVIFVDDAGRSPDELVYGSESPVIMRHREGADGYRIVKMPPTSAGLAARLGSAL